MNIFILSRRRGTSLQMIDRHHGHLAQDAEEQDRSCSMPTTLAPATVLGALWARTSRKTGRNERESGSFAGMGGAGFEPAASCL
jgi:hypothetical protein